METTTTFAQPTRQSAVAIFFILGNVFRILLRQLWVLILIVLFNPKKQVFNNFTLFFLGLAAVGAVISIINYFKFYFYIKDGELVLEKGVFRKTKINVPLDRVQTVNFKQGILHQALNVVAVEIDTAGSIGKEFSLQAIRKEKAEALRAVVESFRQHSVSSLQPDSSPFSGGTAAFQQAKNPEPQTAPLLLFHLSPLDLLKIGVSQNHFRTAGIIMVFFLSFLDDMEDAFDFDLAKKIEELLGLAKEAEFMSYLLIGVPFFLIVSFLITLFNTVLLYFNLRLWRTENGFKMESGLFTRQEVSANLRKIQYLRWSSSPLMRWFNMVSVRLQQAASVQVSRKLSVSVPGCYEEQLEALRSAYFPEEKNLPEEEHGVNHRIVRRQFVLTGLLPVAVLLLLTHSWSEGLSWWWLLWLPVDLWLSIRHFRTWQWFVSEEGVRASWGVVNRKNVLLQWYKVQAVSIRQSYFFRRTHLAHLTLHTAAGTVQIPYIPVAKARAVQDFVLYKAETDRRKWM
ncbi:MAG: PH domain-containing protein [Saprospiraceae bacterium]